MQPIRQGKPLRGIEAAYLTFETPEAPMHMGALALFEAAPLLDNQGRLRIDDLRRGMESRLHLVPGLRQRVFPSTFGPPVWGDDPDFDVANHLHRVAVPEPGGEPELFQLCVDLQAQLLDRDRPLWEIWVVEGVSGGRVAMIEKIHHAMADGMAGVEMASALLDVGPRTDTPEPEAWTPRPPPNPLVAGALNLAGMATAPLRAAQRVAAVLRHPVRAALAARTVLDALPLVVRDGLRVGSHSLNRPVTRSRRLIPIRLPLEVTKAVAHATGATVNDVVLATVTGGLRWLLDWRGEDVDRITLNGMIPVSLRADDERQALGNRTAALFVPLPVHERDPLARLYRLSDATRNRKAHHEAEASDLLLGLTDMTPRLSARLARWVVPRQPFISLVITNMRGPDIPLYLLGARMLEAFPIVPLGGNLDVGVAILSYDGWLNLTVYADAERCPDADRLVEGVEDSFTELVGAVTRPASMGASTRERRRSSA